MDTGKQLTFMGHLDELRRRLMVSVIAVGVCTIVSFPFVGYVIKILESRAEGIQFIYIEMTEMIGVYMKVGLVCGVALAMPVVLYQVVMFLSPGLTRREKGYLYSFLPGAMVAFACGVLFAFFVLIPPAARFLITFGSDIATPQIRVSNFVSLMLTLLFWVGVSFESPLLILILSKLGIVSPEALSRKRRWAIVGAFVLGAIITPTFDPINQSLVAIPLIVLYEVGIILARIARRREKLVGAPARVA